MHGLIMQTSPNLATSVGKTMTEAVTKEIAGSRSTSALNLIAINIDKETGCEGGRLQESRVPVFAIHTPTNTNRVAMDSHGNSPHGEVYKASAAAHEKPEDTLFLRWSYVRNMQIHAWVYLCRS